MTEPGMARESDQPMRKPPLPSAIREWVVKVYPAATLAPSDTPPAFQSGAPVLLRRCTKTSMRVSARSSCQAMIVPPEPSAITVGPLCVPAESHTTAPSGCHWAEAPGTAEKNSRRTREAIRCPRTRCIVGLALYVFEVQGSAKISCKGDAGLGP